MAIAALALLAASVALGSEDALPRTRIETTEYRVFLAPGTGFGAFSQELSLTLGRASVTAYDAPPVGFRVGFDLTKPRRERVTVQPLP